MICHIFVLTIRPGARNEQIQALLDGLALLPQEISNIKGFRFGSDLGLNPGNASVAIVAEFENEEDWRGYLKAPAHERFAKELVAPLREAATAIQITV
jgi:hypothetical protein